jgi:ketosteroid isomerase-like protein
MATQPAPASKSSEDAVRASNQQFYAAFKSLNITEMEAVWSHDDAVECVQPGWDLLYGWEEVRERWARIFANTKRAHVVLSNVQVRVEGSVGWVACTARVTTTFSEGFDQAVVQATNIFVERDGHWLLVAHHGSALPTSSSSTVQ